MGIEIERRFLVANDSWQETADEGVPCMQGYLASGPAWTVRVRLMNGVATLTIKGRLSGITCPEFEYGIPLDEAEALLKLCGNLVEKARYTLNHNGMLWVVDVFSNDNDGLVTAEVELKSENQLFELPPWAGEEVTSEHRYHNSYLAHHPFTTW